ncbi:MAG: REP-associated tyrosine transposase [Janthinobacterium lividum]
MTQGLVRYQRTGDLHFVTMSCYHQRPYFGTPEVRDLFERALETMRVRYDFSVSGYVVMPEHVHLLVSEPREALLSKALQALKLSVAVKRDERPFWQARYYDFNVFSAEKRIEKLNYMHENPVVAGLVGFAGSWRWSSARHYVTGECGVVEIESGWTAARRDRAGVETQVSEARPGAPRVVDRAMRHRPSS